ncbi:molybdenum cofactor guanylyltransferase [Halorussus sp. MSC15.2]|uniref:molybdenum cofactor guanylyltransferase n=1 Tax=Halorussus sp. MSC15.2 TaxID=2283638 RepID=UPI0013D31B92|nr:molybdenum cofactor guanylyltransferase [Halorussus sp. MSC15.2]NEU55500.1 molybdenum cofactor guanylyltransferase [Halorussus sp. MSC15.2]
MPAGVVLAGGRSTRFGEGDKAVGDLAGVPMIRRVADRLVPVVDVLVVNCRADQRETIAAALDGYDRPVRFAIDPDPDEGPMAGIRTGLREVEETDSRYAFVAACDMPFLDPDLVAYLFERARGRDADERESPSDPRQSRDAAVPRPTDWFETTHAVYRARPMADACDAALVAGESRIIEPLFELDYAVVEGEELSEFDADSFENVNTHEEFEAAEERLRE